MEIRFSGEPEFRSDWERLVDPSQVNSWNMLNDYLFHQRFPANDSDLSKIYELTSHLIHRKRWRDFKPFDNDIMCRIVGNYKELTESDDAKIIARNMLLAWAHPLFSGIVDHYIIDRPGLKNDSSTLLQRAEEKMLKYVDNIKHVDTDTVRKAIASGLKFGIGNGVDDALGRRNNGNYYARLNGDAFTEFEDLKNTSVPPNFQREIIIRDIIEKLFHAIEHHLSGRPHDIVKTMFVCAGEDEDLTFSLIAERLHDATQTAKPMDVRYVKGYYEKGIEALCRHEPQLMRAVAEMTGNTFINAVLEESLDLEKHPKIQHETNNQKNAISFAKTPSVSNDTINIQQAGIPNRSKKTALALSLEERWDSWIEKENKLRNLEEKFREHWNR